MDDLADFSNNLATDLGPLLALFGEAMTKQFLSECTNVSDYIIFAMAPIGIITAVVSVIRVCGGAYMRAFIGRAQEGAAVAEVELCTSTGRDVCEMFTKGGITRALGKPWVLELLVKPAEATGGTTTTGTVTAAPEPRRNLWIYRKYLANPPPGGETRAPAARTTTTTTLPAVDTGTTEAPLPAVRRDVEHGLTGASPPSPSRPPKPDTDLPNLSLNVGIVKPARWVFWLVAAIGIILQGGVLVLAGWLSKSALVGASGGLGSEGSDEPGLYAPVMFIGGTIVMCSGMFACAALIGSTTYEEDDKGRRPDNSQLVWLQPGGQKVGDQLFGCYAIFEARGDREKKYIMSTTDERKRDSTHVHTMVATTGILVGFICQFIGLRGLSSWVSIAQLIAIIVMSLLRGVLRMQRRNQEDNQLRVYNHRIHGHELDWFAISLSCRRCAECRETGNAERQDHINNQKYSFHVKAPGPQRNDDDAAPGEARCLGNLDLEELFRFRTQLAMLTGNIPATIDMAGEGLKGQCQQWKPDLVLCREKSRKIGNAICDLAAVFKLNSGAIPIEVGVQALHGGPKRRRTVRVALKRSSDSTAAEWSIDTSAIEALLGLWVWSVVETSARDEDMGDTKTSSTSMRIVSVGNQDTKKHWGRRTRIDQELKLLLGSNAPRLHVGKIITNEGAVSGLVKLWDISHPTEPQKEFGHQPPDNNDAAPHYFFGWSVAETFIEGEELLPEFIWYTKTQALILDICAQEVFTALVASIARQEGFQEVAFSLEGNPTDGRLRNEAFEAAATSFVDHELGKRSEAVLCLLPALGNKVRINLSEETVPGVVTYYFSTADYREAEPGLRWILSCGLDNVQYYRNNGTATEARRHERNLDRLLRGGFEFYRRSIQGLVPGVNRKPFVVDGLKFLENIHCDAVNIPYLPWFDGLSTSLVNRIDREDDTTWPPTDELVGSLESLFPPVGRLVGNLQHESLWALCGTIRAPRAAGSPVSDQGSLVRALYHALDMAEENSLGPWGIVLSALVQATVSLGLKSLIRETLYNGSSILLHAVRMKDDDLARLLHRYGADTGFDKEHAEHTPLLEAANDFEENRALIRLFVPFGANEEKESLALRLYNKQTLFRGVKENNLESLTIALKDARDRGWGIDVCDGDGRTPLSYAVQAIQEIGVEIVKRLLDYGAKVDSRDNKKRTPLHWAVLQVQARPMEEKRLNVIRWLQYSIGLRSLQESDDADIRQCSSLPGTQQELKRIVFFEGIAGQEDDLRWRDPFGSVETEFLTDVAMQIVKKELSRVSSITDKNKDTAFSIAAEHGRPMLIKQLYSSSDKKAKDIDERTPLALGALRSRVRVVKLLLADEDVPINYVDINGESPLMLAARSGNFGVVKILLNLLEELSSTLMNGTNIDRKTALSLAAEGGHFRVVRRILAADLVPKADVNTLSFSGKTPLIYAARELKVRVVKVLVRQKGVEVNTKGGDSWTAMCYAIASGGNNNQDDVSIIDLLHGRDAIIPGPETSKRGRSTLFEMASEEAKSRLCEIDERWAISSGRIRRNKEDSAGKDDENSDEGRKGNHNDKDSKVVALGSSGRHKRNETQESGNGLEYREKKKTAKKTRYARKRVAVNEQDGTSLSEESMLQWQIPPWLFGPHTIVSNPAAPQAERR